MDTEGVVVNLPGGRRRNRRHSEEFKRQVIKVCLQPGVSAAAIALANQLNTNMVRTWVKEHRELRGAPPRIRRHERIPD